MAKKKPKRSYTTTTLDSSGYIEGGGVRALPHNLWVDIKRNKVLYVCLTFILAFFVIFSFLPLVGLLMAFERYSPVKGFFGSQWVGLQNFETFFSGPYVGRLIRNTLSIGVLNLVVNFPAPIIFALILNEIKNKYFKKIVQTISYMENSEITSSTAALQDSSSIYRQNTEYAAIVVSTLPILCIYPFVQKYFVTGMTIGAVKA